MESKRFSSLDALGLLSDREVINATFLIVSARAERLTGQVPCLVTEERAEFPSFIHGADGQVVWLTPRDQGLPPTCESLKELPHKPLPNVPSDADTP